MNKKEVFQQYVSAIWEYFIIPIKKIFQGEDKIRDLDDLRNFIQTKSSIITQYTLYGYLKTRIGTRHVMMFNDEQFSKSIDIAKWNIYVIAIQDLCLYCFSFLMVGNYFADKNLPKNIYYEILAQEKKNGLQDEIYQKAIERFDKKFSEINLNSYWQGDCFSESSYALYRWAPIADELKRLDKKILINSMELKWDNLKKDFTKLISFSKLN